MINPSFLSCLSCYEFLTCLFGEKKFSICQTLRRCPGITSRHSLGLGSRQRYIASSVKPTWDEVLGSSLEMGKEDKKKRVTIGDDLPPEFKFECSFRGRSI